MHTVDRMLQAHPAEPRLDRAVLARCVSECLACEQACTSCADACLGEDALEELARCIRLDLDCADVCAATGRVLTRQTVFEPDLARRLLEACAEACRLCAAECERHAAHHEHCRLCAQACAACERACRDLLGALAT